MKLSAAYPPWKRKICHETEPPESQSPARRWRAWQETRARRWRAILQGQDAENPMTPLQRLEARIAELEAARATIQAALDSVPPLPALPAPVDWESRLSAARAVDALTGMETAPAIEAQRVADQREREKAARQAAQNALSATQQREALDTIARDLEAASALYQRELRAAANAHLADFQADYHRAQAAMMSATRELASMTYLAGQETAAHQLLRSAGVTGDTMTIIAQAAITARKQLLEETDHA